MPKCGFFKRNLHIVLEIRTAFTAATLPPSISEEISEKISKDVTKTTTAETTAKAFSHAFCCVAELVIARTLLRITENLVSFGSFFELQLSI